MPVEVLRPRDLQTRISQSYVNLTKVDSTKWPALTTIRIDYTTLKDRLTSYTVYDQYALRVLSHSEPLHDKSNNGVVYVNL